MDLWTGPLARATRLSAERAHLWMARWTTLWVAHAGHPQAVGCPQAPQGPTTTCQDKPIKTPQADEVPALTHINTGGAPQPSNLLHPYNLLRATQHRLQTGHVPEITGHVHRNAHLAQG